MDYSGMAVLNEQELLCIIFVERTLSRNEIDRQCLKISNSLILHCLDRPLMVFYVITINEPLTNHVCFITRGFAEPSLNFISSIKSLVDGYFVQCTYDSDKVEFEPTNKDDTFNKIVDVFEFSQPTFSQHNL